MRHPIHSQLDQYRRVHPLLGGGPIGADWGYFVIGPLRIISSGSDPRIHWEHVSVSCSDRTPTWEEMVTVKHLFWGDDETVLQFHPRERAYVNVMPFCLHLCKSRGKNHPLPPTDLIG